MAKLEGWSVTIIITVDWIGLIKSDIVILHITDILLLILTYCLMLTVSSCRQTHSTTVRALPLSRQLCVVQEYGQTV